MPKYLVVMQWFGQDEPELKVAEGESEEEVYERFEHNMNSVTVVSLDKVLEAIKADAVRVVDLVTDLENVKERLDDVMEYVEQRLGALSE